MASLLSSSGAPPACDGRESESELLRGSLRQAQEGHGTTWLLTGPPGIGKTFLLQWLKVRAASEGWDVVSAECRERSEVRFAPFEEAFQQFHVAGKREGSVPSGPRLLAYVRLLIAASTTRPCLLLLDDLQWADPESVVAFQVLSRAVGGMRAVLVGALRDSVLGGVTHDEQAWAKSVRALKGEGTLGLLPLEGLSEEASRRVVERTVGAPLTGVDGEQLLHSLWGRTGGNPLYLEELTQQLLSQGRITVRAGRTVVDPAALEERAGPSSGVGGLPPPPSLRRLVLARLDPLRPADLQLLRVAALSGGPFEAAPLAGALQRPVRDVVASLRALAEGGILGHEGTDGTSGWHFAHDLFWEVVLRESPEGELRELARRMAAWYATARPEEVEVVARLFHEARDPVEGLPWVRDAIDRALAAGATASAERFFRWYFELLSQESGGEPRGAREALELVDRLLVRRLRQETLAVLEDLLRANPSEELRWEVGWRQAHVQVSFDVRAAEAIHRRLEEELARSPFAQNAAKRGKLAFLRCELAGARLDWKEAIDAGMAAEVLLVEEAPLWQRGRLLYEIAWAMMMLERYPEAQDLLDEARELVSHGDLPGLRASLGTLAGSLSLMHGRLDEAASLFEKAAADLLEAGGVEGYGIANNDLAEAHLLAGRLEPARRALEEAELVGRQFASPRVLQGCHFRWGWWHLLRREWDLAHACCSEADQVARAHGFEEGVWENRLFRLWAQGELGSASEALDGLAAVKAEQSHFPAYFQPFVPWVEARLLELARRPGAREALTRAVDGARRSSAPQVQAFFLDSVAQWEELQGHPSLARSAREQAERLRGGPVAAAPAPAR